MTETRLDLKGIEVGALDAAEIGEAVGVLARGMRDNPLHVAVLGANAERRRRMLARLFAASAAVLGWVPHMLVARRADGAIVGVCGLMPPGTCRPNHRQRARLLPILLSGGPRSFTRALRWLRAWSKRDLQDRHWHLGPLAIDAHLQGMGIGSRLMRVVCAQLDAAGDDAYLETDKAINVAFYERFDFVVIGQEEVLGVPTWYMCRPPAR